jgi:hypothetical protein
MAFWDVIVERLAGSFRLKDGRAFALGHTHADNLPVCDATRDAEERWITGLTGVADRWVVCEKDAADAYAWEEKGAAYLSTLGGGGGGGGDANLSDMLMLGGM